jgi:hypothetical protein
MADMIGDGAAWLAGQLKSFASVEVTYGRAGDRVTLQATSGRSQIKLSDDMGGTRVVEWEDDWLIQVGDLLLSNGLTEPLLGDTITLATGAKAGRYEILRPGPNVNHAERCNAGTMWRCHCKRLGDPKP